MAETAKQKRDRIAKQAAAAADQFTRDTAALLGLNGSGGSSGGTGLSSAPIRFTGMGTADLLKTIKAGGVKGIIASQMYDALLPVLEASNTTGTSFKQRLSAAFGGGVVDAPSHADPARYCGHGLGFGHGDRLQCVDQ